MTRSEIAQRSRVNSETVRYYEQRGLIPEPPRTSGGYRTYDNSYVERIRFVKRAQDLGFTLTEIKELLDLRSTSPEGRQVRQRADEKLHEVESKIEDLVRMRQSLQGLIASCRRSAPDETCPILASLSDDA